jgi:hypothetical protein
MPQNAKVHSAEWISEKIYIIPAPCHGELYIALPHGTAPDLAGQDYTLRHRTIINSEKFEFPLRTVLRKTPLDSTLLHYTVLDQLNKERYSPYLFSMTKCKFHINMITLFRQ